MTSAARASIASDVAFPPIAGRYLEIRVALWRQPLSSANPLLSDLTIKAP
jgi:hypothetical protein